MTHTSINMVADCEAILLASRDYNVSKGILKTDVATINYLLTRSTAMANAYGELSAVSRQQRQQFLDQLVATISFWSPEDAIEMRTARIRLVNVNEKIGLLAGELASLLDERSTLENAHPFSSNTHYHILDLIEKASQDNYLFQNFVSEPLGALAYQFDLKYWPTLAAVLKELANDAAASEVIATDPRTDAATSSTRSSKADFVRALFSMIDELKSTPGLGFQPSFTLTDSSIADVVNVCLRLEVHDLVDGAYVKNLRHRDQRRLS